MFDIGTFELLLTLAVLLIAIGPKHMPEVARFLGRQFGRIKKIIQLTKDEIVKETTVDKDSKNNNS